MTKKLTSLQNFQNNTPKELLNAWKSFKKVNFDLKKLENHVNNYSVLHTIILIASAAISILGVLFLLSSKDGFGFLWRDRPYKTTTCLTI